MVVYLSVMCAFKVLEPHRFVPKGLRNSLRRRNTDLGKNNSKKGTGEPKDTGPRASGGKRGGKQNDFAWWKRMQKGEFPWDDKDFCSLVVLGAGVAMGFFYLYFRDPGKEIMWKHFMQYYLARGLVRGIYSLSTLEGGGAHGGARGL
ncbi:hypothetical protein HPG69_002332 [Diceros bicornis minor]|uniref:Uncharacterized protein n=1 Tax=Diceros bicornis minor TaxID=77932 RepID=A0A7J7FD40_DICBM|nr:hypothetical protein HPG69_002332 [Diceros bicornis minor]